MHSAPSVPQAARQGAHFPDLPSVLAALQRQKIDMQDLAAETGAVGAALAHAMQPSGDKDRARRALENQQAQLVWLAAETGAMLAALAEKGETIMPIRKLTQSTAASPVSHLYALAEALAHLGETLPEDQAGLALLLGLIGEEVKESARRLDDAGE